MPVQAKEKHFKDLKKKMDKVTERTSALEIKMMNNHKELMNKIETVEKKKQTKHYNSQRNMKQK